MPTAHHLAATGRTCSSTAGGRLPRTIGARITTSRAHLAAYLQLADTIEELGATPCQVTREDWWWSDAPDSQDAAVAACRECPARHPCQAYATAVGEQWGVWGATTPTDRRRAARTARVGRT